mgnify:CR=1 FL=1
MKKWTLATEAIGQIKRQRNGWKVVAIASLILNVIQYIRSK